MTTPDQPGPPDRPGPPGGAEPPGRPSRPDQPGRPEPPARPSRWWLVICLLAVVLGLLTILTAAAALYLAL